MKKLKKILWKYLVEKPIPHRIKLEEVRLLSMPMPHAPRLNDSIGLRLFGIINALGYLSVPIFLLFLISLFVTQMNFLFLLNLVSVLGFSVGAVVIIYESRYKLWLYVAIGVIPMSVFLLLSLLISLKYSVLIITMTAILASCLYFLLTPEGGKGQ